jgi:hypothetical protein
VKNFRPGIINSVHRNFLNLGFDIFCAEKSAVGNWDKEKILIRGRFKKLLNLSPQEKLK